MFGWREARIRRQAAAWIARMNGPDRETHRRALEAWLAEDPRHQDAYRRLQSIWTAAGGLKIPASQARKRLPRAGGGAPRLAWAAGGALLLAAALLLSLAAGRAVIEKEPLIVSLVTRTGEISAHALPGGGRVTLDTQSALNVHVGAREQRVTLRRGRVRFTVPPGAQPLLVEAGDMEAQLNAGTFDLEAKPAQMRLAVLGGEAELLEGSRRAALRVRAGETLIVAQGQRPRIASIPPSARWPEGMLDFEDVPLATVVDEANRYSSGVKIVAHGRQVAALRVTGTFRSADPRGLARALAATFNLRLDEQGGRIHLRPPD